VSRALFWLTLAVYAIALNWLWGIFCIKYGFYPCVLLLLLCVFDM
jgi:hypothetical protein